ncbi:uncharacterized protein LOC123992627 [Tachysurus ichikawai]
MESSPFPKTTFITDGFLNQTEVAASVFPAGGSEECFIDPQLAFIVVLATGSLILALLISVLVLVYKVFTLRRQCQARGLHRSNADVRGSGHWNAERAEEGIVGPCETNLLLEEVQADADDAAMPYKEEEEEEEEEEEAMLHQSNTKIKGEKNVLVTMQSSTSKDSCLDPSKELEDMPLVV